MGEMLPRRREMFSYACGNLTTVRPWNGREPSNASSNFGHFPKKKKKDSDAFKPFLCRTGVAVVDPFSHAALILPQHLPTFPPY